MKNTETPTEMPRLQAAAAVAKVIELADVRTNRMSAGLVVPLDQILERPCIVCSHTEAAYVFDEPKKKLLVDITAIVTLHESVADNTEEKPGREFMRIESTFALTYVLSVNPPPAEQREMFFSAFASLNGTYNAWPYLRELVQSLSARMGLPGLTLPVHRFPRSEEEVESEQPAPRLRVVAGGER